MPITNLENALAAELRARAAVLRISSSELARRVGKDQATVWRKLNGKTGISLADLAAFAEVLGVTAGEITAAAERRLQRETP